jgi:pyruvate/2-oxoglutarate dehydrogenase complex dihydrolipoamide dehydrogenase (E3) component/uncharacterized membrane protein YdjX (TVP38/TMEM64 family)
MDLRRVALLLLITLVVTLFFVFDLSSYLTFDQLKEQQSSLQSWRGENPMLSVGLFFTVYVLVAALSLPGAAVMTLAFGAVFGLFWGVVLVSFASTLGATLAFLIARFLLRDWVQQRFGDRLQAFNDGIEKEGAFYLFTLRLVPVFPFFVINLLMGLTPIRTITYAWVSQVGMLAGTIVFVNAGTQLAALESPAGILSPALLLSFVMLGLFPLIAKKALDRFQAQRVLAGWTKPATFDRNMVVIGAGSGGLVSAYIAAAVKAKVSLIEKNKMGGDCLNTGCVPSKALIRSARFLAQTKRAQALGFKSVTAEFDFAELMERVQSVIKQVEPHDSVERYSSLGVDVIQGEATITSPYTVDVNGRTLTTKNIVIATGARPAVPAIPGLDKMGYLTSDNIWELRELPPRLLVLGGGPIGCELAQCFARFGTEVTMLVRGPRLMRREDEEVAELVMERFRSEGMVLRLNHTMVEFREEAGEKLLVCEHKGETVNVPFDQVLVAIGRRANVSGFGLENLDVPLRKNGTIEVNDYLQTRYPNIYAVGDVTGPFQFTHTAAHQAWYAAVNGLFSGLKRFRVDYSVIPHATFTEPEVGRVGLNEVEAKEQGVAYEVTRYDLSDLDRAIAESEAHGLVKVLTVPGKDRIIGATIVGEHAGELVGEFTSAMKHGYGMNKILGTIHIYPTMLEANKYAAGVWKRAHSPERLLQWVERFHVWRLGK